MGNRAMELLSPFRPQVTFESTVNTVDLGDSRTNSEHKSLSGGNGPKITIHSYCSDFVCRGIQSPLSQRMALHNIYHPSSYNRILNLSSLHPPPPVKIPPPPSNSLHPPPFNPPIAAYIPYHECGIRNKLPRRPSPRYPPRIIQRHLRESLPRYPHPNDWRDITAVFPPRLDLC